MFNTFVLQADVFFRIPLFLRAQYKILMHSKLKVGRFQKKHPLPISKDTEKIWKLQIFFEKKNVGMKNIKPTLYAL